MKRMHLFGKLLVALLVLSLALTMITPILALTDLDIADNGVDEEEIVALSEEIVVFSADAVLDPTIPAPASGAANVDSNRIILRITHTWFTAANYPRWTSDYSGDDALSIWYTDDGSQPSMENGTRLRINPAVTGAGVLTTPRAYIMDYKGGTTYNFVCYEGTNRYSNTGTYTTALNTPRLKIDNNINPANQNNVLRLTSGLYKRSDVANGIGLFSDAADAQIFYQTAPVVWNPAISSFEVSSVDNLTAAQLRSSGTVYDGTPISAVGLDETNGIAIRAITSTGASTNSTAITYKIRVVDDKDFITLQADKDGNFLVDIDAFIAQLTVEEKLMIIGGVGGDPIWLQNGYNFPVESNNDGILRTGGPAGGTPAIPRFNIPSNVLADGPAGLRMWKNCTVWMCPAGIGSTWNADLAYEVGSRYAAEAEHYAVDICLGPGINNQRNPLSGRNFEYYSEDPYILGLTAASQVRGMQDNGLAANLKHFAANDYESGRSNSAYATERSLREIYLRAFEMAVEFGDPWTIMTGYNGINAVPTARNNWLTTDVLRGEWGFKGYVMTDWGGDAGVDALAAQTDMSQSGSRANNLATYVTWLSADYPARIPVLNRSVKNVLGVVVKTFAFRGYYGVLKTDGTYTDGVRVDGTPTTGLTREDIGSRHLQFGGSDIQKVSSTINKQVADEAIVLMRNEKNVLPLKGNEKVALVTSRKAWQEFFNLRWYGDSASVGDVVIQGTGSAQVRFNNSTPDYALTLVEALEDRGFDVVDWKIDFGALGNNNQEFIDALTNNPPAQGGKKYVFSEEMARGATAETAAYNRANALSIADATANAKAAAEAAAAAADVGIFVLTRISGEGLDVSSALFNIENKELLVYYEYETAFRNAGKPFIVLINVGGTTSTTAFRGGTLTIGAGATAVTRTTQGANAIIDIWNPGSSGTEAIADILKGAVNPSGKLPQTFPINFNDSPSVSMFNEYNANTDKVKYPTYPGNGYNNNAYYADGVFVGYRFYESRPQLYESMVAYPFGYGLSYTKFEYSDLKLSSRAFFKDTESLEATVTIKNTGSVAGKEIVQLFLSSAAWVEEGRPKNDLRAYGKTKLLQPGESQTITLSIELRDLMFFDDGNPENFIGNLTTRAFWNNTTNRPIYGLANGWTVNNGTLFTVMIRTNGGDADKPNQPFAGLTSNFMYFDEPQPVTALRIVTESGEPVPSMVTLARRSTIKFDALVNYGAFTDGIVWSVSNSAFATVNQSTGAVTVLGLTGTVVLTAKAPNGITHSVILRII